MSTSRPSLGFSRTHNGESRISNLAENNILPAFVGIAAEGAFLPAFLVGHLAQWFSRRMMNVLSGTAPKPTSQYVGDSVLGSDRVWRNAA